MDLTDIPKDILNDDKYNYKLACIFDNLSIYAYVEIIQSKEAKEILPVLMRISNLKGLAKILITNNGKEFDNRLFKEYLESNKIEKRSTRVYNPQCIGIIERFNKTIKEMIKKDY